MTNTMTGAQILWDCLVRQGVNVVFADVTAAFLGHGAFSLDPWLGQDPANPETFLHPTAEGYEAYAAVISAVR